jgi:hypothetical protein
MKTLLLTALLFVATAANAQLYVSNCGLQGQAPTYISFPRSKGGYDNSNDYLTWQKFEPRSHRTWPTNQTSAWEPTYNVNVGTWVSPWEWSTGGCYDEQLIWHGDIKAQASDGTWYENAVIGGDFYYTFSCPK